MIGLRRTVSMASAACLALTAGTVEHRPTVAAEAPAPRDRAERERQVVDTWVTEVLDRDFETAASDYDRLIRDATGGSDESGLATQVARARLLELLLVRGDEARAELQRRALQRQGIPIGPRVTAAAARVDAVGRPFVEAVLRQRAGRPR